MRDFSRYDSRHYETASVVEGYGEWSKTYDLKMTPRMDQPLLERLDFDWSTKTVLDLACGTGRVGAWLATKGAAAIDGVDLTPGMLEQARAKKIYRRTELADVSRTGLPSDSYDAVIQVLADEHLPRLEPLYDEAARLLAPSGTFILIGYHPFFMFRGVPTHFRRENGENLAIEQFVHLTSDHVRAGRRAGFTLEQMEENIVDQAWIEELPNWTKHLGWPITFALRWSS